MCVEETVVYRSAACVSIHLIVFWAITNIFGDCAFFETIIKDQVFGVCLYTRMCVTREKARPQDNTRNYQRIRRNRVVLGNKVLLLPTHCYCDCVLLLKKAAVNSNIRNNSQNSSDGSSSSRRSKNKSISSSNTPEFRSKDLPN